MANANKVMVVTPKGIAIWPNLNTPDTKFKAEGQYTARLAYQADDPALEPLRSKVDDLIEAKYKDVCAEFEKKGKKGLIPKITKASPFTAEENKETGEETGRVTINAKMTASGVNGQTGKAWTRRPDIFDAKGNKLKDPPQIGGGSELKLSVELFPYFNEKDKEVGVSFRLEGAQIIKLVQFGARDAASHGFQEEDGDDLSGGSDFDAGTAGSDDDDDL